MPSARTHSKALQDADLQSARPNRTTSQRPNIWLVQRTAAVQRPTVAQRVAPRVPTTAVPSSSSSTTTTTAEQQQQRTGDPSNQHPWESLDCNLDSINNIDVNNVDLMIDSGAATHVCPPWFGNDSRSTPWTRTRSPTWFRSPTMRSLCMATDGFTSTTRMVKAWSFLSTCAR